MTQGEFYYLLMVIGALITFAAVLAYGAWMAPGKPHRTAEIKPLPNKSGAVGTGQTESGRKKAA